MNDMPTCPRGRAIRAVAQLARRPAARLGLPGAPTLRAMLEDALKGAGDGRAFSTEEREMLLRILRFGALRVVDVMVPRADIIAVDENEPVWELLKTFDAAGVSRLPLFARRSTTRAAWCTSRT